MALFKKFKKSLTGPVGPVGAMGAPGSHAAYTPPVFRVIPQDEWTAPQGSVVTTYGQPELPVRAHAGDAGWDLVSPRAVSIAPGNTVTVFLRVAVTLGADTMGKIEPRSSMNRDGVFAQPGVVDTGYTGELGVTLFNSSPAACLIKPGQRIAQMVVYPVVTGDTPALDMQRGDGGFGSTNMPPVRPVGGNKPLLQGDLLVDDAGNVTVPDMVNHPPHYAKHPVFSGECHDFTRHMPFDQGNAFKYAWRCASKGDMLENLRKCQWYLNECTSPMHRLEFTLRRELNHDWSDGDVVPSNAPAEQRAADKAYLACLHIAVGSNHSLRRSKNLIAEAIALLDEK